MATCYIVYGAYGYDVVQRKPASMYKTPYLAVSCRADTQSKPLIPDVSRAVMEVYFERAYAARSRNLHAIAVGLTRKRKDWAVTPNRWAKTRQYYTLHPHK